MERGDDIDWNKHINRDNETEVVKFCNIQRQRDRQTTGPIEVERKVWRQRQGRTGKQR